MKADKTLYIKLVSERIKQKVYKNKQISYNSKQIAYKSKQIAYKSTVFSVLMTAVIINLWVKNSPKNEEIRLLFWGGYYCIFI